MDINFLSDYLVIVVVGICLCVGYVIKKSLSFIPNKYIPLIMAILGVIINFIDNGISMINLLGGMFSGLASTGLYEGFRNLLGDKEQ